MAAWDLMPGPNEMTEDGHRVTSECYSRMYRYPAVWDRAKIAWNRVGRELGIP